MSTPTATVLVDPQRTTGPIDDRVYGQFLENMGRAIYGGVFEPGSPLADADGFRTDVLAAALELAPPVLRWPGGNFASGYHWRDGIGPVEDRPTRLDLAWSTLESNRFGTEEFLHYARQLGSTPYLNLNASTGSIDEALEWLLYCNSDHPVPEVALRQSGPHPDPHNVPIWGIGNENFGWWQHLHTTADSYAETTREWGKLLRWADNRISLVGVGSEDPDWNWTVLNEAGAVLDWLSLHFYWNEAGYEGVLAGPLLSEAEICETWGLIGAAKRRRQLHHDLRICVDEWGVWNEPYLSMINEPAVINRRVRGEVGMPVMTEPAPLVEQRFDLKDALAHACWLHVLWRHPDKISLATQAQMVNVIAPIHTTPDGMVRETTFYPLAVARRCAQGTGLNVEVITEAGLESSAAPGGSLPALDAAATCDPASGRLHLSLVNRLPENELLVDLDSMAGPAQRITLWADDPAAANSPEDPERVVPVEDHIELDGALTLPPHSHVTLLFS